MAVREHEERYRVTAVDSTTAAFASIKKGGAQIEATFGRIKNAVGGALVVTAAYQFGQAMVQGASQAEQAGNRIDAVLRATGTAAGVTRGEIDQLADELHELTQFDDDSVRNAAAELAKFGDVQGEVFKQGLRLAADYAAFTGQELPAAAQAVGKALHSPIEGMGQLEREIGKLSPAQKKLIEDLVQSGRRLEAQGVILDMLKDKFGGTAEIMNKGYLGATTGVKKAWDELLESFGKTAAVKGSVESFLTFSKQSLTDLKNIVETGDWMERLKNLGLFMAGFRGMDAKGLPKPDTGNRGAAAAGAEAERLKEWEAAMRTQTEGIEKFLKDKQEKGAKEFAEREKRLREEDIKGWVAHADAVFAEAERELLDMEKIWDEHWKREERLRQEDIKGWVAYADAVFDEAFETAQALADIEDEASNKTKKAVQELGLTFSSAFEDAIVGGKKAREVLQGLAMDVAKWFTRKAVTEPLMAGLSGVFGPMLSGMFGGGGVDLALAGGGSFGAGNRMLVGEQGPEIVEFGRSGRVVPNEAIGGGGVTVNVHFSANTVAAVRDAVHEMTPGIVRAAKDAVRAERNRSGDQR